MNFYEHSALFFILILIQSSVNDSAAVKKDSYEGAINDSLSRDSAFEKSLFGGTEERNLKQEILLELNHLGSRKQREIFSDLEKQHEKFNISRKNLVLSEPENLSPLNVEELKNIRKSIKTSNTSFPAIRNKRTLNFLLYAVARAMGYTLTPTNSDAEWIPRQQPAPAQPPAQPCTAPPPPCRPSPSSTPPPCTIPPTIPPCPGSNALMQPATIFPNRIDANTISYPFRPARTIPLFNFAPLPAGVRVPYPPLLQPPAQQRTPCPPQQPSPSPCGATPAPSPPCGTTPAPSPPPCTSTPTPPCGNTPAPRPSPCATTPAPTPSPCKPTPSPPCGTTPAPAPPPCATTPAPPAPCATTPAPAPPPCATTPKPPPCATPAPPSCETPAPTPAPSPAPTLAPPPPLPSSEPPKKGSILLEYDDPVRIQIFSNEKKYLPASGSLYSGLKDDEKEDWHSYFFPDNEKNKKKNEGYEEKEEMEEEHVEEEEEDEAPGQLKQYEEEDESSLANEEEEDESETSLSIVKKPADQDLQKVHRRRLVSSKAKTSVTSDISKDDEKEGSNSKRDKTEKSPKMKKPKRKKWVRIVKKQRRKSKTDLNPNENFQVHSSDSLPEGSYLAPKLYGKRESRLGFDSFERDNSDYSGDSSTGSSEEITHIDLKKVVVNNRALHLPDHAIEPKRFEFNINPYALEPENERRKKLEKAVERYVEDYVEKQLGEELVKNTGIPKTTVFEFAPKNGPKIQTITTTVAKISHTGKPASLKSQNRPESFSRYKAPAENAHVLQQNSYKENFNKQGDASYEAFVTHI